MNKSKIQTSIIAGVVTSIIIGTVYFVGGKIVNSVGATEVSAIIEKENAVVYANINSIKERVNRMDQRLEKIDNQMQEQRGLLIRVLEKIGDRPKADIKVEGLVDISLLGLHEKKDRVRLTELLGIDPLNTSWCTAFVDAIERSAGRHGTDSLMARSYLDYGTEAINPQFGDIVVLWRISKAGVFGHVGYFIKRTETNVYIYGGNQSDMVSIKPYPINMVLGYRRAT